MKHAALIDAERRTVLIPDLLVAEGWWERGVGLLGRSGLRPDQALWIEPCGSIHTAFMRFSIDAIFLDGAGRIIKVVSNVRPWRIAGPIRGARVVVEAPAGRAAGLRLAAGQRLALKAENHAITGQS